MLTVILFVCTIPTNNYNVDEYVLYSSYPVGVHNFVSGLHCENNSATIAPIGEDCDLITFCR